MKVLGIDPGLANVGFSIVNDSLKVEFAEYVTTSSKLSLQERLRYWKRTTASFIKEYSPDIVCIEDYFSFGKNSMGVHVPKVIGVMISEADTYNIPCILYSPFVVKQISSTTRDKDGINKAVKEITGYESKVTHVNDSIAIALCYFTGKKSL